MSTIRSCDCSWSWQHFYDLSFFTASVFFFLHSNTFCRKLPNRSDAARLLCITVLFLLPPYSTRRLFKPGKFWDVLFSVFHKVWNVNKEAFMHTEADATDLRDALFSRQVFHSSLNQKKYFRSNLLGQSVTFEDFILLQNLNNPGHVLCTFLSLEEKYPGIQVFPSTIWRGETFPV